MPTLTIQVLGSFRVAMGGVLTAGLRNRKAQALLAYLAVAPSTLHRRETLAGLFWPETSERRARHSLSQALSELRHVTPDRTSDAPYLLVEQDIVQFNGASDHWVDAAAFEGLVAACEHHPHQRMTHCDACGERLHEAVAIYRGSFLDGLSITDSPAFEEWALIQRERFQRLALEALHHLTLWHEHHDQLPEALKCARRQLELEPWREVAHRLMMRLLARAGQRSAALAQYVTCRRILAEELEADPEPETTALYEQIRDGGGLGGISLPPNNLPASLTPFVGRRRELAELATLLQDPACRLLTLIGPGGVGKSRLALEVARQELAHFDDGVFLVSLAPLTTLEAVVPTIARAMGLSLQADRSPEQQLTDYLGGKRLLLILDNCEHLVDVAAWVVRALQSAHSLKVMVTSRVRFRVKGEHVVPIGGLAWSDSTTGSDAVELFLQSAQRACFGFRATEDDLGHIARVCRLVRGVPLGILLAAAWIGMLDPEEIEASVERSMDFLRADWQDLPQEQQSLRAVFERSWALLTPREQEAFQGLSVFRGAFTREAAHAVAGVTIYELMALVDKSLLHPTSRGRFELHELVRQFTEERLAESPDGGRAVRDRHSATYACALERWADELKGGGQQTALLEMDSEAGNVRAAWTWSAAEPRVARLAQALEGLCLFYEYRSRGEEGASACAIAADALARVRGAVRSSRALGVRALALAWRARFQWLLRQPEEARRSAAESQTLLERPELAGVDTRAEWAFVHLELGHQAVHSDPQAARAHYLESLGLFGELGDSWSTANVLDAIGYLALNQGDYDDVCRWGEESLAIRRALGDRLGMSLPLMSLSAASVYQGRFAEAERLARERITIHRELDQPAGVADGLRHLGGALFVSGQFQEAREALEECLPILRRLGTRQYGAAFAHTVLGHALIHSGVYDKALEPLEEGLALSREIGYPRGVGMALMGMALLALVDGRPDRAMSLFEEALAVVREIDQRAEIGGTLGMLALTSLISGETVQVRERLLEGCCVLAEIRNLHMVCRSILPAMATFLAHRGEPARAVALYALAMRYPCVRDSRWQADVVRPYIASAAEAMSPEEAAAAQEQGRTADLWATVVALTTELSA